MSGRLSFRMPKRKLYSPAFPHHRLNPPDAPGAPIAALRSRSGLVTPSGRADSCVCQWLQPDAALEPQQLVCLCTVQQEHATAKKCNGSQQLRLQSSSKILVLHLL